MQIKSQNKLKNQIFFKSLSKKIFIDTAVNILELSKQDIVSVINYLQWKTNFIKLHKNDRFSIITNFDIFKKNINSKKKLLAIHIKIKNKDFYAIKAKNGKFYDQNGLGLLINFMRFPIKKKYRISSNFNLHRLHPITGYVIPHRGVDFAIPIGTPVLVVGDGKVIITKKSIYAGNYITIKHNNNYITKYMHLKKILVKKGQIIKMGDKIALSGNTGRSTGPHLHYEIWIHSTAVNPLKTKLPIQDKLTGKNLKIYLQEVKKIIFN